MAAAALFTDFHTPRITGLDRVRVDEINPLLEEEIHAWPEGSDLAQAVFVVVRDACPER